MQWRLIAAEPTAPTSLLSAWPSRRVRRLWTRKPIRVISITARHNRRAVVLVFSFATVYLFSHSFTLDWSCKWRQRASQTRDRVPCQESITPGIWLASAPYQTFYWILVTLMLMLRTQDNAEILKYCSSLYKLIYERPTWMEGVLVKRILEKLSIPQPQLSNSHLRQAPVR